MLEKLHSFTEHLILDYGYGGIFGITAFEQFIFPLPADLFFGFSIENGLHFGILMWLVFAATVLGSTIGYVLGKYLGHPFLIWLVSASKVKKGEAFMKKWGVWGVIIAGITPIPFKVITWMAGIFEMPFWKFILGVIVGRMPRYLITAYLGAKFFETKFYASDQMSAIILGLVQGLTEFLPISSTGHVMITEHFLTNSLSSQELFSFNILLHLGSLLVILIYFRKEWYMVLRELWQMIRHQKISRNSWALILLVASLPAALAGFIFAHLLSQLNGDLKTLGMAFLITGTYYFYVTWKTKNKQTETQNKSNHTVNLRKSFWIGLSQCTALIPGISRTGSTLATGLLLGIEKHMAARFSLMLGAITILGANTYTLLTTQGNFMPPSLNLVLIGVGSSILASWIGIHLLIKLLKKHSLAAYGIYLVIAGSFILSLL